MRGLTAAAGAPCGTLRAVAGPVTPDWRTSPACLSSLSFSLLLVHQGPHHLKPPVYLDGIIAFIGDAIDNPLLKFFAKKYKRARSRSPGFGPCNAVIDFEAETRLPLALRHTHRTTGIRKQHLTVVRAFEDGAAQRFLFRPRVYADNLSPASTTSTRQRFVSLF